MIITLILLVAMCLWGIQTGKGRAYEGYISKGRSNAIKGQFILIVFLSHIQNYIVNAGYVYHGLGDEAFLMFFNMIGQLMVVMFLFYSGFGVMESIRIKGDTYIRTIPKHRVLNTLVNFDIAVCFFLIVDLLIGKETSLQKFILSLTTWDNLGNSNWYIFSILVCYFVTGILARVLDTTNLPGGVFVVLTIVSFGLYFAKEPWWYNTLWAYPAGMFFSVNKNNIEDWADRRWLVVVSLLLLTFCLINMIPFGAAGFKHNSLSVVFALLIVVLSMRIRIDNKMLRWCGELLFPLYIYQRIPMMVMAALVPSFVVQMPLLYIAICFTSTILMAYLYRFIKVSL